MLTVERIRELKNKYIKEIYDKTREEQKKDAEFINDTFQPNVRDPHRVIRLGLGYEVVNSPAEQIVTSNPQAFVEVLKGTEESGIRIAKAINGWIDVLRRQNPNPFKECIKNDLGRGESYIKILHKNTGGLPCYFLVPDSMVIYGSPEEDDNGIPKFALVFYERQLEDVILRYPDWTNPKKDEKKKLVEWFEYWAEDQRYFEADGETILNQPNIYRFTPFVRKYSGFGRRSPDGELSSLIVGDLRYSRGWIEEITTMYSDIASVLHLSAHKPITILAEGEVNEDAIRSNLNLDTYIVNILDKLPEGFRFEDIKIEQPTAEAFQHASNMMAGLMRRHPYINAGFPWGTSGRQQEKTDISAMRRYDTIVENTENQWATAFEKAFKISRQLNYITEGLQKKDMNVDFRCFVQLRAKDPIESDRLATLGSRLLANGEIDPETNLIEFKGYTQDRARQILIDAMKWKVIMNSPDIIELIGLRAAEKAGMAEDLQIIRARRQQLEGQVKQPTPSAMQRVMGETQTVEGIEEAVPRGARQPPERYTRGS